MHALLFVSFGLIFLVTVSCREENSRSVAKNQHASENAEVQGTPEKPAPAIQTQQLAVNMGQNREPKEAVAQEAVAQEAKVGDLSNLGLPDKVETAAKAAATAQETTSKEQGASLAPPQVCFVRMPNLCAVQYLGEVYDYQNGRSQACANSGTIFGYFRQITVPNGFVQVWNGFGYVLVAARSCYGAIWDGPVAQ